MLFNNHMLLHIPTGPLILSNEAFYWSNWESKILKHLKRATVIGEHITHSLTLHLPSDVKFTCWGSCKPGDVLTSRYKDILWKEVHHRNQCRVFFYHTIQMCSINSLQEIAVCKKRHITNLCRIISLFHMHFMAKGQTGTLNTNELNMIFHPTIIPNPPKETSSIYLAPQSVIFPQKQWVTWQHDTQHTDTSIFQYSIWVLVT